MGRWVNRWVNRWVGRWVGSWVGRAAGCVAAVMGLAVAATFATEGRCVTPRAVGTEVIERVTTASTCSSTYMVEIGLWCMPLQPVVHGATACGACRCMPVMHGAPPPRQSCLTHLRASAPIRPRHDLVDLVGARGNVGARARSHQACAARLIRGRSMGCGMKGV